MNKQSDISAWPFILPLLVFMLAGMFEPRFAETTPAHEETSAADATATTRAADEIANDEYFRDQQARTARRYIQIYAIKALLTCSLLVYFRNAYLTQFPPIATGWSLLVGGAGVLVWVVLCQLNLERTVIDWFGGVDAAARSQFNPFARIPDRTSLAGFLALRFFGLVIMVPICEELFLRGFLMRYIQSPQWWSVSLSRLGTRALMVAPLYGALTHPTEALAAIAWFSLVTWLVCKTGKFWDAVIAHAVTNGLLGLYVCLYSQWQLW